MSAKRLTKITFMRSTAGNNLWNDINSAEWAFEISPPGRIELGGRIGEK